MNDLLPPDTRVRMVLGLAVMIAGRLFTGWPLAALVVVLLLIAVRTNLGTLRRFTFALVLPTALLILPIYAFVLPEPMDASVPAWGCLTANVERAGQVLLRLMIIASTVAVLTSTTSPADIATALMRMGLPPTAAILVLSSFHLKESGVRRLKEIADAQRSRGMRPKGLFFGRIRAYIPILRPLLFSLMTEALERCELWQTRGHLNAFTPDWTPLRGRDWGALIVAILLVCIGGLAR